MKHLALIIGALMAVPASAWAQDPPGHGQPLDMQARALMWSGHAAAATRSMREYVASHPTDDAAVLDLARYLTWAGDYAGAESVLDAHPGVAESPDGQAVRAALLAWAGRIDAARAANAAVLAADPDGLLPNYTQAVALRQSARPQAALPYVEAVKRANPDSKDARDLERAVGVRTDSFVALDYRHGSDSDDLVRSQPTLRAELAQGDALRWTMDFGRWDYRGPSTGPFSSTTDGRSVVENRGLVGVRYAASLSTQLSAAIGQSSVTGDSLILWRLGLDQRVGDSFRFDLTADRDRLDASPRSLSLGLDRTGIAGHAQWTPDLDWTGDLWLRRDHYSDGNDSVDVDAAMRRAVVRIPHFMLDLGVSAQHLAYDDNPGNGYYAPSDYRRYALVAYGYVGLSDEAGLAIQAGLGRQRDETLTSWRRANDISASLVIGIFSSWQLNLSAGYSQRMLNTGAYAGHSWGAVLTRRF